MGKLNKSFGTKGQIKVVPLKAFHEDLESNDVWFVKKNGEIIPYFVEYLDVTTHFLVKFEDVDSPEQAKKITGGELNLRAKDVKVKTEEEDSNLDKLVGFGISKMDSTILGTITSIEEYPQQLMAFVSLTDSEYTVMIPLSPEFINDIDPDKRIIWVELPDGLIESQFVAE